MKACKIKITLQLILDLLKVENKENIHLHRTYADNKTHDTITLVLEGDKTDFPEIKLEGQRFPCAVIISKKDKSIIEVLE